MLLLIGCQSTIFYLWCGWEKQLCFTDFEQKKDVFEQKNKKTFVFLSEKEINWEKEGKELNLNGKLYDVVFFEKKNNLIVVSCVSDELEDYIVATFKNNFSKNICQKNIDFQAISQEYIQEIAFDFSIFKNDFFSTPKLLVVTNDKFFSRSLEVVTPPPKLI